MLCLSRFNDDRLSAVMSTTLEAVYITEGEEAEAPHCQPGALTDRFGLIVQLILAVLAFASLVLKRALEPALVRRPWTIWFFDTSKQAAGAGVIHLLNVFLAGMFRGDPCTWYVVSFLLDSTLGLLIIYIGVKSVSCIARWKHWHTLRFGEYGKPPGCRPWFHQCLAFVAITVAEKIGITVMIQFKFWREVRKMILRPIHSERLELILVMLVIPFIVNTLMFWVVDNFTKRKTIRNSGGMSDSAPSGALLGDSSFLMEGKNAKRGEGRRVNGGRKLISEEEIESLEKLLDESPTSTEIFLGDDSTSSPCGTQKNFSYGGDTETLIQRHNSSS